VAAGPATRLARDSDLRTAGAEGMLYTVGTKTGETSMYLNRARIVAIGWAVPLGLAVIGVTPGFAQVGGLGSPGTMGPATKQNLRSLNQATKPEAVPPSLPGTKKPSEAAAPTTSPADMTPTEALFDAINRGDAAAARDAVNRGADLHGLNVLGLTPLELSVDLGRNDISFLLLSMRDGDATSRSATRTGAESGQADAILRAASPPAGRSRVSAASSTQVADDPVAVGPRPYSGDGGTPIPAAGFLGFDPGRTVR
jgi:hypothetical protein